MVRNVPEYIIGVVVSTLYLTKKNHYIHETFVSQPLSEIIAR